MNHPFSGIAGGAAFSFLTAFNRFFGLVQIRPGEGNTFIQNGSGSSRRNLLALKWLWPTSVRAFTAGSVTLR